MLSSGMYQGIALPSVLTAQDDAVPTFLFLMREEDLGNHLLHMPPFGNYFKYSIVAFCVRCKFRPKSQS